MCLVICFLHWQLNFKASGSFYHYYSWPHTILKCIRCFISLTAKILTGSLLYTLRTDVSSHGFTMLCLLKQILNLHWSTVLPRPTFAIVPRSPLRVIRLYSPESQLWGCGPRSLKSLGPQDHPLNFPLPFIMLELAGLQISGEATNINGLSHHTSKSY